MTSEATSATNQSLRKMWAANQTTLGAWLSIPSVVSAEASACSGADYVCIDTQHGAIDYQTSVAMIGAITLGGSRPIARVPWNEPGCIGKMLDAGCEGVIVPMVNTREQAEAVVASCRYAPDGTRSFGPTVANMRHANYHKWAYENVSVIPMIETVEALSNLDAILSTPGIDAIYVGPADLSLSLGLPPGNNDDAASFTDALHAIVAACRKHGVIPGMHTITSLAAKRLEQGFKMLTMTSDILAVRNGMRADVDLVRATKPSAPQTGAYGA
jgi:4-hydroxy-2-oxoheptanedioate aldolase